MNRKMILVPLLALAMYAGSVLLPGHISPADTAVSAASSKLPAPENLRAKTGKNSVRLSWDKVEGAEKYRVLRYDPTTKKYYEVALVSGTSVQFDMLNAMQRHYFRVAAVSSDGREGSRSEKISAKPKSEKVPTIPHPAKYGFDAPPKELEGVGAPVSGYILRSENDSVEEFLDIPVRGTQALDNYVKKLKSMGFTVVRIGYRKADNDTGYMVSQTYDVYYGTKQVCKLEYIMDMTNFGEEDMGLYCQMCALLVKTN